MAGGGVAIPARVEEGACGGDPADGILLEVS